MSVAHVRRSCVGGHGCHPWCGSEGRTKSSSAELPKVAFLGDSFRVAFMSMSCACLLNSASKFCIKGLRDIGRLPALVGVLREGEGMAGDPARLRNGLFEESSRERGDGRRSR
jgi:hypothetical protein